MARIHSAADSQQVDPPARSLLRSAWQKKRLVRPSPPQQPAAHHYQHPSPHSAPLLHPPHHALGLSLQNLSPVARLHHPHPYASLRPHSPLRTPYPAHQVTHTPAHAPSPFLPVAFSCAGQSPLGTSSPLEEAAVTARVWVEWIRVLLAWIRVLLA